MSLRCKGSSRGCSDEMDEEIHKQLSICQQVHKQQRLPGQTSTLESLEEKGGLMIR